MENQITADEIRHEQNVAVVKTITCKRVLNLGNYNTRHLEMVAEVPAGVDADAAAADLVRRVEAGIVLDESQPSSEPKPKPQPVLADANSDSNIPW